MIKQLEKLAQDFETKISQITDAKALEEAKKEFLGKDSTIAAAGVFMRSANADDKKTVGKLVNDLKNAFLSRFDALQTKFKQAELHQKLSREKLDVSVPGLDLTFFNKHPLNLVIDEIYAIFSELGYDLVDGTELESDEYCFQKLNLPIGHPARDMQDTFYIDEQTVLRTHSTNMTARMLTELAKKPVDEQNVAAVSFGNVYRRDDDDATHSHQFMQIDGFAVGQHVSFANLKWVLQYMCQR